jgi:hypothetical protein
MCLTPTLVSHSKVHEKRLDVGYLVLETPSVAFLNTVSSLQIATTLSQSSGVGECM